jgi:hypothetical protein
MTIRIPLDEPILFGNEAAEDEREDVFLAHVLERPELAGFADERYRVQVVRAYKGEGKSALLRLTRLRVEERANVALVLASTGSAIVPSDCGVDSARWVRGWKASIVGRIAAEVGSRIGFAWSDDAMSLVEEAEKTGFRERSFVGAILSRFKPKLALGGAEVTAGVEATPSRATQEALVQRWAAERGSVWLFLDDIDQNFQNTPEQRAKVAGLFIAARELANQIPELRVRAAVRPNVWTTIKLESEALSHVEQYVVDLTWSERQVRDLLAKRVDGYLTLTHQRALVANVPAHERERELIKLVFQDPMEWGRGANRPPHVVLYTLSKHRPRWMIELSKGAARRAVGEGRQRITRENLVADLAAFGNRRVQDTIAEFSAQCPEVGDLIAAFRQEPEQLTTDELYRVINNKIANHLNPKIVGVVGRPSARDIAAFLFQAGFFYGRQDFDDGSYQHVTFSDRPHLFTSRSSPDDGLCWEVHPVFRQALEMRDATGAEIRRRPPSQR